MSIGLAGLSPQAASARQSVIAAILEGIIGAGH
jgi:hypothetical protein